MVVGVIDTGVDYNHPDLVDNMWTNPGEIPGDGIDNDGNGFIDDVYGCERTTPIWPALPPPRPARCGADGPAPPPSGLQMTS